MEVVRYEVVTVMSMNMAVFCDIAPCSVIDILCHFRGVYCLHRQYGDGDSKHL